MNGNVQVKETNADGRGKKPRGKMGLMFFRDLRKEFMMFLAMIILCFLGVCTFSGLIDAALSIRHTLDVYFEETALPDMWIRSSDQFSRSELTLLKGMPGVKTVQLRSSVEASLYDDMTVKATLSVYFDDFKLNRPYLVSGQMLSHGTHNGCLVEDAFAKARGLKLGDMLTLNVNNRQITLRIVGTVLCPEYIKTADGGIVDHEKYGFVMTLDTVLPELPCNTVLYTLEDMSKRPVIYDKIIQRIPSAMILDREDIEAVNSVNQMPDTYIGIAIAAPLLMFLVAALIVISTLKRLIDNHRTRIGVLKALGFTETRITVHYLLFAIIPTFIGCMLGMIVGPLALNNLLWQFVTNVFVFPYTLKIPLPFYVFLAAMLPVFLAVAVCIGTLKKVTGEWGAALLKPPAPAVGRRTLLERAKRLWNKLGVKGQMVARNISRNRKRSLLSLIGVFVCNLLIVTSLGIRESVSESGYDQYGDIMDFDYRSKIESMLLELNDAETEIQLKNYKDRLAAEKIVGAMSVPAGISYGNDMMTYTLSVIQEPQTVIRFLEKDGSNENLPPEGVCATQVVADKLGFKVGSTITLFLLGHKDPIHVKVSKIVDFITEQGLYMSENAWRRLRAGPFTPNSLYIDGINIQIGSIDRHHGLAELTKVLTIDDYLKSWLAQTNTIDKVFLILIAVSLCLCFMVCYNMGLISYIERRKEYATMKVLGFYASEMRTIVASEGMIVSLVGLLLGLIPVNFFAGFALKLVSTQYYTFNIHISAGSYLIGSAITFVFSLLIQLLIVRKVQRTDILESLKNKE